MKDWIRRASICELPLRLTRSHVLSLPTALLLKDGNSSEIRRHQCATVLCASKHSVLLSPPLRYAGKNAQGQSNKVFS